MLSPLTMLGVLLACAAALVQTLIHASLKATDDRITLRTAIGIVSVAICMPLVLYLGLPSGRTLWWLAGSTLVHLLYQVAIIHAYRSSDFSVAYPVLRGLVPIVSVATGWFLLGDRITMVSALGVLLGGAGLAFLSLRNARSTHSWAPALLAGGLAAAYSVIDAAGIRSSDGVLIFIAWFFVLEGVTMTCVAALWHRTKLVPKLKAQWRTGLICGLATLISYSASLISFKLLPLSAAASLHLSSVIFSVAIARLVLKERVDQARWTAGGFVFVGAVLVVLGLPR